MLFNIWLWKYISERPKRVTVKEDAEKKDEEEWILKDVIFVEDVKSLPVGKLNNFSLS